MKTYNIKEGFEFPFIPKDVELGDKVELTNQTQEVVECQETKVKMLNIDAEQLAVGDLKFIKKLGLTISNPDTDKPVALGVDFKEGSFGAKVAAFFTGAAIGSALSNDDDKDEDDDDDDSSFFHSSYSPSHSSYTPSSSGGFGGGSSFGGFGGGSFSGGGASRGF